MRDSRYYSGVRGGRTTRCCSAGALIIASSIAFAQSDPPTRLALFPVQTAWTVDLGPALVAPPAVDEARVYFATGDGLVAYELARGSQVWSMAARPVGGLAADGGLLFSVETERLIARRSTDGEIAWQIPFAEPLVSPPAAGYRHVALATPDSFVVVFRGTDGQLLWRRQLPSPARGPMALTADRVYVPTEDGRVTVLRLDRGDRVWERRLGGPVTGMRVVDTRVYLGSTDNFLYCLNARDGRVEWRWRTGADLIGVPVVDERSVYFLSLDNVLRALSRTSGVQQWFRPLSFRPASGPMLAGTTVLVPGLAQTVPAFDAATGAAVGDLPTGGGGTAPLLLVVAGDAGEPPGVLIVARDADRGATAALVTRQR
jgi:outer membrane protein assembly factor BamB